MSAPCAFCAVPASWAAAYHCTACAQTRSLCLCGAHHDMLRGGKGRPECALCESPVGILMVHAGTGTRQEIGPDGSDHFLPVTVTAQPWLPGGTIVTSGSYPAWQAPAIFPGQASWRGPSPDAVVYDEISATAERYQRYVKAESQMNNVNDCLSDPWPDGSWTL